MAIEPWIGEKYATEGLDGARVLALGESHYGSTEDLCASLTQDVVRNCVYEGRHPYFTKVAKLLRGMDAGTHLDDQRLRDTWDRIAFYNFIQQLLPESRVRPTPAMWTEAQRLFPAVLQELKPDLVVVMGKALRDWFPPVAGIEVCFTEHPSSSRFSYSPWSAEIQAAIARARARLPQGSARPPDKP